MEALDQMNQFRWNTIMAEDVSKAVSVYTIKVQKVYLQLSLPLCALLYDVAECTDLVSTASMLSEPCFSFLSTASTASVILRMIILAMILLGTDNGVHVIQGSFLWYLDNYLLAPVV